MGNSKSKQRKKMDLISKEIKQELKRNPNKDIPRIVLLGTGQSGKTTIFHQLNYLHTQTSLNAKIFYGDIETKGMVRQNIVRTINLILQWLAKAYDQGDQNCDISVLDLLKKDQKILFVTYFDEMFQNANDIRSIPGTIRCLARDMDELAAGKTILSGMTDDEMRQELNDLIENRMPLLKQTMKANLSDMFDLNNISDCIKLLLTYSGQEFNRFDASNLIATSVWDATLDNTNIDMFTATTEHMSSYSSTIFDMIRRQCTDRCLHNLQYFGKALDTVWNTLPQFRYVYCNLGAKFPVNYMANMDYYFNKCLQIFRKDFVLNPDDLIRINCRTTGIVEQSFDMNGKQFTLTDTGGQKSERKKWRHCFNGESNNVIIYVAALDHFRLMLYEDSQKNAMKESVECFEQVLNKWSNLQTILILAKPDLFKQSLRQGHSLSLCFDEYNGMDYSETFDVYILNILIVSVLQHKQDITIPSEIVHIIYKYLDNELSLRFAYINGIEFVKQKFLSVNNDVNKKIGVFVVNSIVVDDVKILMRQICDMMDKITVTNH